MKTIRATKILKFLNKEYPKKIAEHWDHVGIQLGSKWKKVSKILVTLDITSDVVNFALKEDIDLVISHHPFLFFPTLEIEFKRAPYKKKLVAIINGSKMLAFSMHTNFDKRAMGEAVARKLGFKSFSKIKNTNYGLMVSKKTDIKSLIKLIKTKTSLKNISTNASKNMKVKKIAFFPGAGPTDEILIANESGADVIVTSDIKWSEQITINEAKIKLIHISHSIENAFVDYVAKKLKKQFKFLQIFTKECKEII